MKNITGSQAFTLIVLGGIQGFSGLFVGTKVWNLAMVPVGFPHLTFMQLFWTAFVLRIVLDMPSRDNKNKEFNELVHSSIGKTLSFYALWALFAYIFK